MTAVDDVLRVTHVNNTARITYVKFALCLADISIYLVCIKVTLLCVLHDTNEDVRPIVLSLNLQLYNVYLNRRHLFLHFT